MVTTRTNKADSSNAKVVNSSITSTSPSKLHQVCHNHQFKVLQVRSTRRPNATGPNAATPRKPSTCSRGHAPVDVKQLDGLSGEERKTFASLVTASMLPFRELSAIRPKILKKCKCRPSHYRYAPRRISTSRQF